ncbi:hypothetical protein [Shewanella litorisediminis]|uniref:Uncharacterized protein n=1 Tax=Shewanella litorisediminis TaxID=1173586 RepID=A0ABX7G5F8_9GAMM|nr:hypothetical protein [Shewanella litorisediminis]MCL2917990.1 hypothetical protein [Shewanella litorisediminis]QRH02423.1 hypothetical protein JQC75_03070 [Shewanella litorisediminis]
MKNIALLVNLEGMNEKVTTDWNAVSATLKKRQVTHEALVDIYAQLCAGLKVSTRGLTLAKLNTDMVLDNVIRSANAGNQPSAGFYG